MLDLKQFISAIDQIAEEKGIPKDKVLEIIEMALAAAYKKDYAEKGQNIRAKLDPKTGEAEFFQALLVVDETMILSEEEIAALEKDRAERDVSKAAEGDELPTPTANEKNGLTSLKRSPRLRVGAGERSELAEPTDTPPTSESAVKEEPEEEETKDKKFRFNPKRHIMIGEAAKTKPDATLGEELLIPLETKADYGRIAAQTAKQVIIQRIREAEREVVYETFKEKEGDILSATVERIERGSVYVDIGRATGILFPEEQIPQERYRIGQRLRVYVVRVDKDSRGPAVVLSRKHPKIIAKLFELEVPEVASGVVEIKAIAREAGSRSKVAVASHNANIDPVGSCVGQRGIRVSAVISELGGENIDIVAWSEDEAKFVSNALSPAKVLNVNLDEANRVAVVEVSEDQLSLAIGKRGQNVRLAAELTGWRIDVKGATPAGTVEAAGEDMAKSVDAAEGSERQSDDTPEGEEQESQTVSNQAAADINPKL